MWSRPRTVFDVNDFTYKEDEVWYILRALATNIIEFIIRNSKGLLMTNFQGINPLIEG